MKRTFCCIFVAVFLLSATSALADNPTAEEILTRHLRSIGSDEARKGLQTLFVAGLSNFESKNPSLKGVGKAVVVSDSNDLYFLMSLNSSNYPYEKIGAFGSKVSLPFTMGNERSLLGAFLHEHYKILTNDLFCGSMSLRWIQRLVTSKDLHLSLAGRKKVNGQQTYAVDVSVPGYGSNEFTVRLFFDADKYYHIRTEYHRIVGTGNVTMGVQNNQTPSNLDLTEEFSDFRTLDGLTFPYKYRVTLTANTIDTETMWGIDVANYYPNQRLAPDFFTFDPK